MFVVHISSTNGRSIFMGKNAAFFLSDLEELRSTNNLLLKVREKCYGCFGYKEKGIWKNLGGHRCLKAHCLEVEYAKGAIN